MNFKQPVENIKQPLRHNCKKYFTFQQYGECRFIMRNKCQNRLLVEHQPNGQLAMEPEMPPTAKDGNDDSLTNPSKKQEKKLWCSKARKSKLI